MHRRHHPRRTGRMLPALLGGVFALAFYPSEVSASGPKAPSTQRAEPWLGKVTVAAEAPALVAAAKKTEAAAARTAALPGGADQIKWWSTGGAAYRWNEIVLEEMQEAFIVLPMAARQLALYHAAIDDAVAGARGHNAGLTAGAKAQTASEHAAAAAAASAMLAHFLPARGDHFAGRADEAVRARRVSGVDTAASVAIGEAIGRKVAAAAIERAKTDGGDAKWTGTVPEGAGRWKGSNPIAPMAATWKPWVLASPSELRPPAPPAVDSDQVKSALAELKSFQRTPKSNHRAVYWEVHGGARAHILWNEIARMKLMEYGMGESDGARVLAALNIALADAGVACWDAKYAFWYIRPPQLDAELKSLFPPPNHPSYPAAHGCFSTAAAAVLAGIFTRDRERILALGKEAAEARVWAGIHYRFDIDVGQEIGRKVGEKVLLRAFGVRAL